MTAPRPRRFHDDGGFTLIEVIMSIVLTATIMGVLAAAIMVTLGPDQQSADRLASSHDAQVANEWLPADLASAGPVDAVADLAPSATVTCTGSTPGNNVLRLGWNQPSPVSTNTAVSYRVVPQGATWQLVRYVCTNGGAVRSHLLIEKLLNASAVHVELQGRRVVFSFTTIRGDAYSVTGVRRTPNPAVPTTTTMPPTTTTTLPPTTTTTLPPTTTTLPPTTTTTLPPGCVVTKVTPDPTSVDIFRTWLFESVDVRVTTTGTCSGLRLSYRPNDGSATIRSMANPSPGTWTATIPGTFNGGETWTVGDKTLSVLPASGSTPYPTTGTLKVT